MPETIKASEQNLLEVFSDKYLFEIPSYQRPYTWDLNEVSDLLDDLQFAVDRDTETPYFLGSIVLIKGEGSNSEVIDGQQRLTTLTMLLCTLRELADDQEVKDALDQRIRQKRDVLAGTQEVVRLHLRQRDQDFFHANVQDDGGVLKMIESMPPRNTDSQERIFENAKLLYRKLKDQGQEHIKRLAQFIIRNCYLVTVTTADKDSAYRIFSVMNDRGVDLSPTDILKAHIVGEIEPDGRQEYSDKWENIEQELGRERFGELFAHTRMIFAKAKARNNLQDEFQEFVLKEYTGTDFVDNILEPYADAFERVLGVAADEYPADADKFGTYLRHLQRLDNRDWIPPTMAFFHSNPRDLEQISQFIKDLERLAYGLFIRRANINERLVRYAGVLRAIERGYAIWQDDSPLQLSVSEKADILQTLDGPVYTLPRVPQPLLLRLDGLVAGAGARYDHSVISIEHVLPQHPRNGSQWFEWFPDDEERGQWTHRLANLALLSHRKNAAASNWDFETKKSTYFLRGGVSPFALTSQVLGEPEWKPEVLERRQRDLIDRLKVEWRLD